MGTSLIRAMLLASAGVAVAVVGAPTAAYAQEATYQIDIPAQSMGDALRALGKAAKQNIVFSGSVVKGKRSAAVRGRMTASEALQQLLAGSGLQMARGSGGGFTVVKAGNGPIAGAQSAAAGSETRRGQILQGQSILEGAVVDEATGAALKGATIEIEGAGKRATTDESGKFYISGVPQGTVTVRVSYLGYQEVTQNVIVPSGRASVGAIGMRGGSPTQEIVVYGTRSARAQSLNQERSADNSRTVISSDLLGDFTGTTISESLRRAPGITFRRDPLTGDGTNIQVRGLAPDFNAVKFNGVELPETTGKGRSASLGNILTESISQVTIHKSLLPSQDSAGTGGLVEIETKSPLDRPRRFASAKLEYGTRAKNFNKDLLVSGTLSGRFGAEDRFGISASLQYRKRRTDVLSYDSGLLYGQYLPLQVDGTPTIRNRTEIDPRKNFPFAEGANDVYVSNVSYGQGLTDGHSMNASVSAAWQIDQETELVADYQYLYSKDDSIQSTFEYSGGTGYGLLPVQQLGGQTRRALRFTGGLSGFPSYSYVPDTENKTNILTLRGKTRLGDFFVKSNLGYAQGKSSSSFNSLVGNGNFPIGVNERMPSAVDPIEGRVLTIFGKRPVGDGTIPVPLLSQAGFDLVNDPNNYYFFDLSRTSTKGQNRRLTGDLSVRYEPQGSFLKHIEVGATYESTKVSSPAQDLTYYFPSASFGEAGLSFGQPPFGRLGISSPLRVLAFSEAINFFNRLDQIGELFDPTDPASCSTTLFCGDILAAHPDASKTYTRENELGLYVQSQVDVGPFSLTGGVRMSRFDISSVNLQRPDLTNADYTTDFDFVEANTKLVSEKATQTAFLPRFLLNYRPAENFVARLGYFQSIARPQINLLSQEKRVGLFLPPTSGPNFDQPFLQVSKGNPDLKSARTHSFDLSLELYTKDIGVIKAGLFYKRINNFLENNFTTTIDALDGVELPDDPRFQDVLNNPQNYFVTVSVPFNNEDPATIKGAEFAFERQLTFLPGALSGLGVYANYTYTESSKTRIVGFDHDPILDANGAFIGKRRVEIEFQGVSFNSQPKHSGTFAVTYNKFGIDSGIYYSWQSRRKTSDQPNSLSSYEEAYSTLDFRFDYRFNLGAANAKLNIQGLDLLRGPKDPTTRSGAGDNGTGPYISSAYFVGGRQIRAGVSVDF